MARKIEFAIIVLNLNDKTFIVYIAYFASLDLKIHLFCRVQKAFLKTNETFIAILANYINFISVLSLDLSVELLNYTIIKNYTFELIDDKQPSYELIYNLELIELEILKTYIKTNLANNFIKPFKFPINASILFIWKINNSL